MASLLIIASVVLTIGLGLVLAKGFIAVTLTLLGSAASRAIPPTRNEAA